MEKSLTGEDLQKELDLLKELVDKVIWKDRWDRNDEYKSRYVEEVIKAIEDSKREIRRLLRVVD